MSLALVALNRSTAGSGRLEVRAWQDLIYPLGSDMKSKPVYLVNRQSPEQELFLGLGKLFLEGRDGGGYDFAKEVKAQTGG